jgi:hypothetical protein
MPFALILLTNLHHFLIYGLSNNGRTYLLNMQGIYFIRAPSMATLSNKKPALAKDIQLQCSGQQNKYRVQEFSSTFDLIML